MNEHRNALTVEKERQGERKKGRNNFCHLRDLGGEGKEREREREREKKDTAKAFEDMSLTRNRRKHSPECLMSKSKLFSVTSETHLNWPVDLRLTYSFSFSSLSLSFFRPSFHIVYPPTSNSSLYFICVPQYTRT